MDTVTEINAWMEQGKALMQRLQAEQGGSSAQVEAPDDVAELPDADKFAAPDPADQPGGDDEAKA